MTVSPELDGQAREFAADVADLLNGTITDGVRLGALITWHDDAWVMQVGYGISKNDLKAKPVPIGLGLREPHAFLLVAYYLTLDPEGIHLAVLKSQYGLYLDPDRQKMVVHWDYERSPIHRYPAAHVQVHGSNGHLSEIIRAARERLDLDCPDRALQELHLPVGGRRFRPSLEDVIEFLIVEKLASPRDGWRAAVDAHRRQWEERQLRAAVRRYPEVALAELREGGHLG